MSINNSSAQTLGKYADQLYFGMQSFKPDTTIEKFIRKYVPVVYREWDTSVKWTAYPPDTLLKEPAHIVVTSAYVFKHHPYFNGIFTAGQLAITQKIYEDTRMFGNITDLKLWFEFDNALEAKQAFKQLIDKFASFHVLQRISKVKGIEKAEFTDLNVDIKTSMVTNRVQLLLIEDYALGKKYAIPTGNGFKMRYEPGYKILIETDNNLNW